MSHVTKQNFFVGNDSNLAAPSSLLEGLALSSLKAGFRACVGVAFQGVPVGTEDVDVVVWGLLNAPTPRWVTVGSQTAIQSETDDWWSLNVAKPELYSRLYIQTTWNTVDTETLDGWVSEYVQP